MCLKQDKIQATFGNYLSSNLRGDQVTPGEDSYSRKESIGAWVQLVGVQEQTLAHNSAQYSQAYPENI